MLNKILYILIALFVFQLSAISQNIDATLGTGGTYTIKDASNTFLTVTQTTGYLNLNRSLALPSITVGSANGTIYKGADRFIHTYEVASTYGENTFIGINSGNFTMTGAGLAYSSYNTAVGYSTLTSLTTGYYNSAFGWRALCSNNSGTNNCAFGMSALYDNSTGSSNAAFGRSALESNIDGIYNSAFGAHSLYSNTSGNQNSAFGNSALYSNTTGYNNSAFGDYALYSDSTGNFNSAFGRYAGYDITTGSNLTCIGFGSEPTAGNATNQVTLGNNTVSSLRCNVTTITAISDARDKKNIKDLDLGIDFLMKVKPRLFNWDRREWYENKVADGSKMEKTPSAGFIAQELDKVQVAEQAEWLKLVLKNNPDRLEATPGNLLPVMVKAIQQLKAENNELKAKLAQFEQVQKLLVSKMEKLESTGSQIKEVKMSENK